MLLCSVVLCYVVVGGRKGLNIEGGGEEQEDKYKKERRKILEEKVRFTSRTGFCTNSVSSLLQSMYSHLQPQDEKDSPPDWQILKLLGNHKSRLISLEEPLLVQPDQGFLSRLYTFTALHCFKDFTVRSATWSPKHPTPSP